LILAAIAIGAVIGLVTARRIAMTAMPQLVAAFHSLVGLAAVLVAASAFLNRRRSGSPCASPDRRAVVPQHLPRRRASNSHWAPRSARSPFRAR
jgi:NAD/NADP transhydrogenase beta subunit